MTTRTARLATGFTMTLALLLAAPAASAQNLTMEGVLSSSGSGNNHFLGNLGIGTTTPSAKLHVNGGKSILGSPAQDYWTGSGNWNFTLQLDGTNHTSIGFHDAGHSVGDITYVGRVFYIGRDIGWGPADVSMPSHVRAGGLIKPGHGPTPPSCNADNRGAVWFDTNIDSLGKLCVCANDNVWHASTDFSKTCY